MTWHPASAHPSHATDTQNRSSTTHESVHELPEQAILLGVFKAVEVELLRRNLLGQAARFATPLWFIAETERNVFLWRSGKSLDDRHKYSFWIDLEALMDKRRNQIGRTSTFNPFINISPSAAGSEVELLYLDRLDALLETITSQASSISRAGITSQLEIIPETRAREVVIIPQIRSTIAADPKHIPSLKATK